MQVFRQSLVSAKWLYSAVQQAQKVHITEGCTELSTSSAPYYTSHIANASYTNLHELSAPDSKFTFTAPTAEQFAQYLSNRGRQNVLSYVSDTLLFWINMHNERNPQVVQFFNRSGESNCFRRAEQSKECG